jgi:predicted transport protein
MPIYKQTDDKLIAVKEKRIGLEKTLQTLVETNLNEVFNLSFVASEFPLNNLRIDTLAFDEEAKAFVVIEYKRDKNFTVIDQGYAYLALLLNNKADFVLEYNEKTKKNLRKDEIDWSQSRVIFIAQSFTKYQQEAIGFQDLPIELWEVKKYDDNLVSFNQIRTSEKSESIKTISKNKNIERVSREIKQYSVEDHIKPSWSKAKELFDEFSQRVLELDSRFEIHPVKYYIGFNIENKNVVAVKVRTSKLLLELLRVEPKDLKDPEKRARYRKNSFEYFNKHITQFDIASEDDIDYAVALVKQVYKKFTE